MKRVGEHMKHIEQFNYDINQSDLSRYEKWKCYRDQISYLFNNMVAPLNLNQKRLLVLGAGRCDDIDLHNLRHKFNHITLADIDLTSMRQGIEKQGLISSDFNLLQIEFTGYQKIMFFEHLLDDLQVMKTKDEIETYLKQKTKLAQVGHFIKNPLDSFDVIMITPIYTQLIYHQILKTSEVLKQMNYAGNLISAFEQAMLNLMPSIIDHFNTQVIHLLDLKGLVFVLSDIFQSHIGDEFDKEIMKSIGSIKKMDLLYQKYNETYGYGLGDYGLLSMSSLLTEKKYSWLIWPFDQHIHMTVKCVIYSKEKDATPK